MNIKFAFDILNLNRSDQRPLLSSDKFFGIISRLLDLKNPNMENNLDEKLLEEVFKEENEEKSSGVKKLNLQILLQLLSPFKPDLKIMCQDKECIQSYKLLFGMVNKHLGDIFLHDDFLHESLTTVVVPCHSGEMKLFLEGVVSGSDTSSDLVDLFSNSSNILYPNIVLTDDLDSKADMDDGDGYGMDVKGEADEGEDYSDSKPDVMKLHRRHGGFGVLDVKPKEERKVKGEVSHCGICGKACVDIKRHIQRQHTEVEMVTCDICGKELKSSRLLWHKKEVHGDGGLSPTVMCPKCGKEVGRKWIAKHTCAVPRSPTVQCPKCGKEFERKEYRRTQHKFNCVGGQPKQCEKCGKEFSTNSGYQFHIKTHDPNNYMCDQCDYATNTKYYLYKHMQTHQEQRKLKQCPICGKGGIICLGTHIKRVHELEGVRGKCEICGMEMSMKTMKNHMRNVHQELVKKMERKYSCSQCEYKATSIYNMKLHVNKMHPVPAAGGFALPPSATLGVRDHVIERSKLAPVTPVLGHQPNLM